ncbi:MAG: electron transfer flavoprotein subunit alpha/FixB family protein [Pseudomonadota bacterium]
MTDDVWVIVDHDAGEVNEVTIEVLGEARELARRLKGTVGAVLLGRKVKELAEDLGDYGADRVYVVEHDLLDSHGTDISAAVMADLVLQRGPSIVIFGATARGSDLATRLAAHFRVPIATDCVRLALNENGRLMATRPSYEDQVYTAIAFTGSKPHIATMRPGVIGREKKDPNHIAQVVMIEPVIDPTMARVRVRRRFKPDPATLPLTEAEMIVAGGAGAGTTEDWSLIEQLARNLGASVGGSRLASDLGLVSADRVIGQSGHYVAPRLYLGIGVSGATHHTQGMKGARSIIAINKDRAAPIFTIADLKVLCDLHQLLPELNGEIRRAMGESMKEKTG